MEQSQLGVSHVVTKQVTATQGVGVQYWIQGPFLSKSIYVSVN